MTAFFFAAVKGRCPGHPAFDAGQHRFKSGWGRHFFSEKDIGDRRCPFSILSPVQVILP